MDLRQYFKKVRETEVTIPEPFPFIVSLNTDDGGKAGRVMEVTREDAAKAIVEGRAELASEEQKKAYLEIQEARKRAFEKAELARRLQISIVSEPETSAKKQSREERPEGSR